MSNLARDHRNRELAQIHIAVTALQWSEDDYRAILKSKTGETSSGKLDSAGRKAFLAHLRTCGWNPAKKAYTQADKIAWYWQQLVAAKGVENGSKAALMAFVGRTTGMEVSDLEVSACAKGFHSHRSTEILGQPLQGQGQKGDRAVKNWADPLATATAWRQENGDRTVKDWADLSTELLPLVLQDFVRLIGLPATMKVVERHGGRRLYIPINPTPWHHLAELIGLEKLTILSAVYGLEDHFDIPKAVAALRHLRNQRIRSEYGPKSASKLAAENDLTERQIWNIVGRAAPENTQQSQLFG